MFLVGCAATAPPPSQSLPEPLPQTASQPSPQSSSETKLPDWLLAPPENTVTACAKVKGNDLHTAKTIVVAKAQAALLSSRKVAVQSRTMLSQQQRQTGAESTETLDYNNQIHLQSSGNVDHTHQVLKEAEVDLNQEKNLCVLFG
ncbi:hypothetical protein C9975_05250 [Thalassospira xiamenensis]|nr:hypothetical protein C9975_05250 [Thalassospira xiamenensis]